MTPKTASLHEAKGYDMANHEAAKNTICLWYDKNAEAAARFYAPTFPGKRLRLVQGQVGCFLAEDRRRSH
jgi:3-demethylubiquinone-9 3-methyltransferase